MDKYFYFLDEVINPLPYIALISIVVVLGICLILIIFGFFYHPRIRNMSSFNVRVYSYNFKEKQFHFFDKSNLSNMRVYNNRQFFSQFALSDQEKIKAWLTSIISNSNVSEYIQVNVKIKSGLTTLPSMLEYKGYNENAGVIHFESYIVPHLSKTTNNTNLGLRSKKKNIIDSLDKCQDFVDKVVEDKIISFFHFKIYRVGDGHFDEDGSLIEINSRIRKALLKYLGKYIKMHIINDYEEVIIDKSISTRTIAINVGNTFASTLKQFIAFNFNDDNIRIAVGVTISSYCDGNIRKALDQTSTIVRLITNGMNTEKVVMYDPSILNQESIEQSNLHDIKMLIKNSTYRLYFDATINIKKRSQDFFYLRFIPYGTTIKNLTEVLHFCNKIPNGEKLLFEGMFKKIKERLGKEKQNILIRLPINQIKTFVSIYNLTSIKDRVNWIIGVREKEVQDMVENSQAINDLIEYIKHNDMLFAIFFKDSNTILSSAILDQTNYFVFDEDYTNNINYNDIQANLRVVKNNLSNYMGEICFVNLNSINDIELYAHYCGSIFQCNELKLRSSNLETLDKDKINYIVDETRKLIPQNISISLEKYKELSEQKNVYGDHTDDNIEKENENKHNEIPQEMEFPNTQKDLIEENKATIKEPTLIDIFTNEINKQDIDDALNNDFNDNQEKENKDDEQMFQEDINKEVE